jgi:hypothetical protein
VHACVCARVRVRRNKCVRMCARVRAPILLLLLGLWYHSDNSRHCTGNTQHPHSPPPSCPCLHTPSPKLNPCIFSTRGHQKGGSFEPVAHTILVRIPLRDNVLAFGEKYISSESGLRSPPRQPIFGVAPAPAGSEQLRHLLCGSKLNAPNKPTFPYAASRQKI